MRAADSKLALRATWLATRAAASVSPRAAGPLAARLWFTPWRIRPNERGMARQAQWLDGTERLTFTTGRHRIAAFAAGSGPVVVLVHGWGERAASLGAFIDPLTAAGYRVVGIDLPGHGDSSGGAVDGFEVSAAIRSVCDELGAVHAVVGHSMGGMATTFAAAEGLDVDALVLLAPSARLDHAFDTFTTLLALPTNAKTGLKQTIDRRYGSDVWQRLSGVTAAPNVRVPALVVHDREDPQVAFADAEELVAALPEARLVTTDGLGHGRILRDENVIRVVVSFLAEVRSSALSETAGA